MRYWIRDEDEDYEREMARAEAAGDALPANLSFTAQAIIATMVAVQVTAFAALAFLIVDWLRANG